MFDPYGVAQMGVIVGTHRVVTDNLCSGCRRGVGAFCAGGCSSFLLGLMLGVAGGRRGGLRCNSMCPVVIMKWRR